MTHLSGSQIGKRARTLTAALVLGTAILSLAPGQVAHAARAISTEAGGADSGGDQGPLTPGTTQRRRPIDDGVRCAITRPNGHVEFYLPGSEIILGGKRYYCTASGHWMVTKRTAAPGMNTTTGGGVYTPAP